MNAYQEDKGDTITDTSNKSEYGRCVHSDAIERKLDYHCSFAWSVLLFIARTVPSQIYLKVNIVCIATYVGGP